MNQQTGNHHTLMLDIARESIRQRAAKDGYEPTDYDAERDPEGYMTSLLNALQKWAHRHGIDWDKELARAQAFYEQDVEGLEQEASESVARPDISELRCPKCGHEDSFVIEVSECLLMFADGIVLHGDSGEEWGDWSYCRCHSCDHRATVYQFRKPKQGKEVITHG
jgi:hypothetical protein